MDREAFQEVYRLPVASSPTTAAVSTAGRDANGVFAIVLTA
jgi:hypothetical protein